MDFPHMSTYVKVSFVPPFSHFPTMFPMFPMFPIFPIFPMFPILLLESRVTKIFPILSHHHWELQDGPPYVGCTKENLPLNKPQRYVCNIYIYMSKNMCK